MTVRERRSIVELIGAGSLDTQLAATIWLLLESRVPLVVAGASGGVGKSTVLDALLAFVPGAVRVVALRGDAEDFAWLPQASELGWPGVARGRAGSAPVRPDNTVLLVDEVSDRSPADTWGSAARIVVRAAVIGYGLAATVSGDSLDDVFETLRRPPVGLTEDELSRLGVVLVLRRLDDGRRRVVAAHWVRPAARDTHGHLQRLRPAVLMTWTATTDTFVHFGWGVTPELAMRVGRRAGDVEIEVDRRRDLLDALLRAGTTAPDDVRNALGAYRRWDFLAAD